MQPFSPARRDVLRYAAAVGGSLLGGCRPSARDTTRAPFVDGTLRLDLHHEVRHGDSALSVVRIRAEVHWPGRTERLNQALDWGDYRLSVSDAKGALLFRSGFDSSLDSAASAGRTDLSVRLPLPREPVHAVIEKRRAANIFQAVWAATLDPSDGSIDRSPAAATPRVDTILSNGPAGSKADLAILCDGYREAEYAKFAADAKRATDYLFSVEPFATRMRDFNVYSVFVPSAESGATDGYLGVHRDTAFRCAYGAGEAERTLAVGNHHALCEAASAVAYDFLLVLVNARRYGGSAYFGGPAVVAIDSAAAKYLVVHEFAHVIGGLADEYYIPGGDGPAYRGNVEPWNPNVTLSPAAAKWRGSPAAPSLQPQPWNKAEYERYFADYVKRYFRLRAARVDETAIEKFMSAESARQASLLAKNNDPRRVQLFEGANGYARGMFRSEVNCIMFSLQTDYFCGACTSAIETMIREHAA